MLPVSSARCTRLPFHPDGRVFVGDRSNSRIQIFDQDRQIIRCYVDAVRSPEWNCLRRRWAESTSRIPNRITCRTRGMKWGFASVNPTTGWVT